MSRSVPLMPFATLVLVAAAVPAFAQQPAERPGRYSMSPADGGGFVRLDTETGAMSICQRRDGDWACRDMKDDGLRLQKENDRLASENQKLKDEIKRLEDFAVSQGPSGDRRDFKLPSEEDVDKAMSYVERMLKKFRDKMKELEGEKKSTPL